MPRDEERYIEYALADLLRCMRRRDEVRLKDVGARLNVSTAAVHLWETGASSPGTLARWQIWAQQVGGRLEITLVDADGARHEF